MRFQRGIDEARTLPLSYSINGDSKTPHRSFRAYKSIFH